MVISRPHFSFSSPTSSCINECFCCCIKHWSKPTWKGMGLFQLIGYSPSWRECCLLVYFPLLAPLGLLCYHSYHHCLSVVFAAYFFVLWARHALLKATKKRAPFIGINDAIQGKWHQRISPSWLTVWTPSWYNQRGGNWANHGILSHI